MNQTLSISGSGHDGALWVDRHSRTTLVCLCRPGWPSAQAGTSNPCHTQYMLQDPPTHKNRDGEVEVLRPLALLQGASASTRSPLPRSGHMQQGHAHSHALHTHTMALAECDRGPGKGLVLTESLPLYIAGQYTEYTQGNLALSTKQWYGAGAVLPSTGSASSPGFHPREGGGRRLSSPGGSPPARQVHPSARHGQYHCSKSTRIGAPTGLWRHTDSSLGFLYKDSSPAHRVGTSSRNFSEMCTGHQG